MLSLFTKSNLTFRSEFYLYGYGYILILPSNMI